MSATVVAEKANLSLLERKDRELQGKVDMMNRVEIEINSTLKLLEACGLELKKYESAKQTLSLDKESLEKKQSELRELNVKELVDYSLIIYNVLANEKTARKRGRKNVKIKKTLRHQKTRAYF